MRMEKFFKVHHVKPLEQLRVTFINMEGDACHWFQYYITKSDTYLGKFFYNFTGEIW